MLRRFEARIFTAPHFAEYVENAELSQDSLTVGFGFWFQARQIDLLLSCRRFLPLVEFSWEGHEAAYFERRVDGRIRFQAYSAGGIVVRLNARGHEPGRHRLKLLAKVVGEQILAPISVDVDVSCP